LKSLDPDPHFLESLDLDPDLHFDPETNISFCFFVENKHKYLVKMKTWIWIRKFFTPLIRIRIGKFFKPWIRIRK